jgi:hypothetical protein
MSRPVRIWVLAAVVAPVLTTSAPALAQTPTVNTIHPIFAAVPDLPHGDEAHRRFAAAVTRHRLGPVEVVDVPGAPAAQAKELLKTGKEAVEQKRFDEAEKALDDAAKEIDKSGAAGLTTDELASVFLYQAMAAQKADWKDPPGPVTSIQPEKARQAYLRAAVLAPGRKLLPRQFPPLAIASWALAVAEVEKRPRGGLLVRAPSSALISVDGGPLTPGLKPMANLIYGDHWVRVEDPGRRPWAANVPLAEASMEITAPETPPLELSDALAARHARRQGAAYALVAEPRSGRPVTVELRLVEVAADGGNRRDAATVPLADVGALETAVMRLEEAGRRARLTDPAAGRDSPPALGDLRLEPVPPSTADTGPRFAEDPGAWARQRWPLLTAVGVAIGTTVVLGILAANDSGR